MVQQTSDIYGIQCKVFFIMYACAKSFLAATVSMMEANLCLITTLLTSRFT